MKDVQITIDLETASLKPNAAIIQIAAVAWNANSKDLKSRPTIYDKSKNPYIFNAYCDLRSCLVKGMDFNADTIKWWASQSEEAKAAITNSDCELEPIDKLIAHFFAWIEETKKALHAEKVYIWAQGTDMDITVLRTVSQMVGITDTPWEYCDVCDSRTYIKTMCQAFNISETDDMFKMPTNNNIGNFLMPTKHNALYDALQTSWNVFILQNMLKETLYHTNKK